MQNVDYSKLTSDKDLFSSFRGKVQKSIARTVGASRGDVDVELSAGSVAVRCTVRALDRTSAEAVQHSALSCTECLGAALAFNLLKIEGIYKAATGQIIVSNVSSPPLSTSGPPGPQSGGTPGGLPGLSWVALVVSLALLAVLCGAGALLGRNRCDARNLYGMSRAREQKDWGPFNGTWIHQSDGKSKDRTAQLMVISGKVIAWPNGEKSMMTHADDKKFFVENIFLPGELEHVVELVDGKLVWEGTDIWTRVRPGPPNPGENVPLLARR